jgi:hypothetical protein
MKKAFLLRNYNDDIISKLKDMGYHYPEKYHIKKQSILTIPYNISWGTIVTINNEDINTVLNTKTLEVIDCGTNENNFIELSKIFLHYNILTKKQIIYKLKNMKVGENIPPIRSFAVMVLNDNYNTNKPKLTILNHHFFWKCIEHENGVKDYYCDEYLNKMMNIKNLMEIF